MHHFSKLLHLSRVQSSLLDFVLSTVMYWFSPSSPHSWRFAGPANHSIELVFQSFATECVYDVLYVYDGPSFVDTRLAALSGRGLPSRIVTSSNVAFVHFFSDQGFGEDGFRLTYRALNTTQQAAIQPSCPGTRPSQTYSITFSLCAR